MTTHDTSDKTHHPLILGALRRTRRINVLTISLTLPLAIFCLLAPVWSDESGGILTVVMILGGVFLAAGGVMVWHTARTWSPASAPVMRLLRERPGDIVWIYEEQIHGQAAGITVKKNYMIKIEGADKKTHTLAVKGTEKDELLAVLAEIAPHATFGYSREIAKQYKADPRSLASTPV